MMSNKPHLRPHQKKRQASRITGLLVVILIVAIFALGIALEATGHVVFRGRLILLCGGAVKGGRDGMGYEPYALRLLRLCQFLCRGLTWG
jgi:hypothetical protein